MGNPFKSTAAIQLRKILSQPCGQECIDWAVDMVERGSEGVQLLMLATTAPPLNHFDIAAKRDRALIEQKIDFADLDAAANAYAVEWIHWAAEGEEKRGIAFREIGCLYADHDLTQFRDFYLLGLAERGLRKYGFQYYWPMAEHANLDAEMAVRAKKFLLDKGAFPNH